MTTLLFERSEGDRVVAGVCGGIAAELGVDATLVRLLFALLALAGGAGLLLYGALWAYTNSRRRWVAFVLLVVAGVAALSALGLSAASVAGVGLIAAGLLMIMRRGGSLRPSATVSLRGLALVVGGAVFLLEGGHSPGALLGPGAITAALLLVVGPWLWRLATERAERIRLDERAEVAARVHDSVLQTLALIQRHAEEPRRVTSLARRQERELRGWLYGDPAAAEGATLVSALANAAAEIEDLHGARIELASSGDCALDDDLRAVVLAAREAMANAAKFSGADEIAVFAEAGADRVAVYVRDRGAGFDRAAVPGDRRGLTESVEGRMARAGGTAVVTSAPGEGTEVELMLPRERA
jgi:signal transduction histidine kinase